MSDRPITILMVEDNLADARILKELLADTQAASTFDLLHARRLSEAVEMLEEQSVDVVLLDLTLPDAHGLNTLARALAAASDVPIIVLTGLDDSAIALRAVQEGAQDYLVKGEVTGHLLLRAIRYSIERKRTEESNRQRAEAEAAERRSRFLADAGGKLAASLDYDTTLTVAARLALPTLADYCLLDLLDEGGEIHRAVIAAAFPEDENIALELKNFTPSSFQVNHPLMKVIRTGEPVLVTDVSDLLLQAMATSVEHYQLLRRLGPCSFICLPLAVRGRTMGAITLISARQGMVYGREELNLGLELAGRISLAIENARVYREAQQVIAVVSHDLRNPLNVIVMAVSTLRRKAGLSEDWRSLMLEKIESSAERMNRLIQDLLDVTRIEAGVLAIEQDQLDAASILIDAFEMLRPLAEEQSLKLEYVLSPERPTIPGDRERLLQVFSNLVGNAIKFTPPGGEIVLGLEALEDEVLFWVQDSGRGISEEDLPRLFDRYFQASRGGRQGVGLGLAIVRGIVQAHKGRIWAQSRLGEGSRLSFSIPIDTRARTLSSGSISSESLPPGPLTSGSLSSGALSSGAPAPGLLSSGSLSPMSLSSELLSVGSHSPGLRTGALNPPLELRRRDAS